MIEEKEDQNAQDEIILKELNEFEYAYKIIFNDKIETDSWCSCGSAFRNSEETSQYILNVNPLKKKENNSKNNLR